MAPRSKSSFRLSVFHPGARRAGFDSSIAGFCSPAAALNAIGFRALLSEMEPDGSD
jgi:hypothetical protein